MVGTIPPLRHTSLGLLLNEVRGQLCPYSMQRVASIVQRAMVALMNNELERMGQEAVTP
jgi:hypothetical protein